MLLTLDFGTSQTKIVIFNTNGNIEYKNLIPNSYNDKGKNELFEHFKNCIDSIPNSIKNQLKTICFCGAAPSLMLYNKEENLIIPPDINKDKITKTIKLINEQNHLKIYDNFNLAKILTIKTYYPVLYQKAEYFFDTYDLLFFILCGKAITTCPNKQLKKYYWNNEILNKLMLDKKHFPNIKINNWKFYKIKKDIATILNIPFNIKVLSPFCDFVATFMAFEFNSNTLINRTGTTETINYISTKKPKENKLLNYCLDIPQKTNSGIKNSIWIQSSFLGRTGDMYSNCKSQDDKNIVAMTISNKISDILGKNNIKCQEMIITGPASKNKNECEIKSKTTKEKVIIPENASFIGNIGLYRIVNMLKT